MVRAQTSGAHSSRTVGKLRKEIESVSAAQFMRWLLRWQHLTPETQLFGEHGTLEILRQLQGYEAPANAWERQLLSRRIAGYDPKILDQLCFNGMVGWGRLSPGPAIVDDLSDRTHRIAPTGAAPITFFTRDESDWMITRQREIDIDRMLSSAAKEVFGFLKERGASFFADILRGTRKGKEEVEAGLWELVAAGLITADGFDNLRALIDPKRRDLSNRRDGRPRYSAGRWSLLFPDCCREPRAHARGPVLGSTQALRSGFSRSAHARIKFAELARNPHHVATVGRPRRSTRRKIRGRFPRRTICACPPQWNPCEQLEQNHRPAKPLRFQRPIH